MKLKQYSSNNDLHTLRLPARHGMIQHLRGSRHTRPCSFGDGLRQDRHATLEAYRQLRERGDFKGVLIVAPLRVCSVTWPDQVARWGFPFTVANLRTEAGRQAWHDGSADIYLINFELVSGRGSKKGFLDEYVGKDMPVARCSSTSCRASRRTASEPRQSSRHASTSSASTG